jgi:hypothetical protein
MLFIGFITTLIPFFIAAQKRTLIFSISKKNSAKNSEESQRAKREISYQIGVI